MLRFRFAGYPNALAFVSVLGASVLVVAYHMLARKRARVLHCFTRHKLPQRIILIRHGESMGNLDDSVYSHVPDWRVRLSPNGHSQAIAAGRTLRQLIQSEPCVFYVSPYYRARETFANIALQLEPEQVREVRLEPRLREQDWGNYQRAECMRTAKLERGLFGRFFYRFPNGESGADVYDRVSTFLETLARDILSDVLGGDTNAVIVSHGLTIRLFLMRWYKWPVELFEGTDNPGNAQTIVMERRPDGTGYELAAESLAIIGLALPAGSNYPTLLARQFEHLRRSLGESAGFCEFASANAALRALERDDARRPNAERVVPLERCESKVVTAEDVARAQRRAELLASGATRVSPLAGGIDCFGAAPAERELPEPAGDD
jgi:broad specificity phosphatase PhoE